MEQQSNQTSEEIKRLTGILNDGISSLRRSVEWQKYLKVMSKFPKYSYRNSLLIMLQSHGTATHVMSYKSWPSVNRYVRKGAKSLKIFQPCPIKKEVEHIMTDDNGNALRTTTGQVMTETVVETVPAFRPIPVFDIKDTEGEPLPTCMVDELRGDVNRFSVIKECIIASCPVPISYEPIEGNAKGYYSPAEHRIVLREGLSELHQIHTLLHETAHAKLNISGEDDDKIRSVKELEAESIAFVSMCHILGDDISPEDIGQYSFGYLSIFSGEDDELKEFKNCLSTIQKTSAEMIEKIDSKIEEYVLSQTKEIAYKLSDGYLYVQKTDEGYDYTIYNTALQLRDGGRVDDQSLRIDQAAEIALNMSDIYNVNTTIYDVENFKDALHRMITKRQILATEICISCYGEDPLSETYVGPSEQAVFTMLSNGIPGDFYNTLSERSLLPDPSGKFASELLRRIDKIAPLIKEPVHQNKITQGVHL